jgi:antirestriction protein ArdC
MEALSQHSSVYSIVTEQVLKQLESGVAPWRRPWTARPPKNLISGREYRGINVFLLAVQGYGSPYWLTYRQATERGGHVRKGEHGTKVVFWKVGTRETQDAEGEAIERKSVVLRYYTVFNLEQCEQINTPDAGFQFIPRIEECERIVSAMPNPPTVEQDGRAWYRPSTDTVGIPARGTFDSAEGYYSTLFHELVHSTGHAKRLGRDGIDKLERFGSESYSKEELVAEMGAAMLCGVAGIERKTLANTAAYLKAWSDLLKSDSRIVVSAASQAQKAADYVLGQPVVQP